MKWTYSRDWNDRLLIPHDSEWVVKRDGEIVGRVIAVSAQGGVTFQWIAGQTRGHTNSLPAALDAVRDALA